MRWASRLLASLTFKALPSRPTAWHRCVKPRNLAFYVVVSSQDPRITTRPSIFAARHLEALKRECLRDGEVNGCRADEMLEVFIDQFVTRALRQRAVERLGE